jgi:branched-chain amino acid transport system ATP-binding protein
MDGRARASPERTQLLHDADIMTAITLAGVSKSFGGVAAISDLTLAISRGRLTGLIGPNGAGKTTVVNVITGIAAATRGRVAIGARDITEAKPEAIARCGVARTFQNIRLLRDASVLDNVIVGYHRHEETSLLANLLGLPSAFRERARFGARAKALLERFGMTQYALLRADSLSYGHQRRVEMMRAVATGPDFLLLDEPVAGMNDVEAAEIGAILKMLVADGIGILLIEHNVGFVMDLCATIYVMNTGRLIAEGTADAVQRDPAVIAAYLGA